MWRSKVPSPTRHLTADPQVSPHGDQRGLAQIGIARACLDRGYAEPLAKPMIVGVAAGTNFQCGFYGTQFKLIDQLPAV